MQWVATNSASSESSASKTSNKQLKSPLDSDDHCTIKIYLKMIYRHLRALLN